jgi:hypothetical protein
VGSEYDTELPSARPRVVTAERVVRVIEIVHESSRVPRSNTTLPITLSLISGPDSSCGPPLVVVAGGDERSPEG